MGGKVQKKKNLSPRRKEVRVEKNSARSMPPGARAQPRTYHVLGESPQLHAMVIVLTSKPFLGYR